MPKSYSKLDGGNGSGHRELIERVRTGSWNPEKNETDREQLNAMAARGYPFSDEQLFEYLGTDDEPTEDGPAA